MQKSGILLLKELEELGLNQLDLASFLNITRQTLSKILNSSEDSEYVVKSRLDNFELIKGKSPNEAKKIIELYLKCVDIAKSSLVVEDADETYLNSLFAGIDYLHHWLTFDKYCLKDRESMLRYIQNFYPRINPISMFFTFFDRTSSLLTYNINEYEKIVTKYVVYNCDRKEIILENNDCSFSQFVHEIYDYVSSKKILSVFRDIISDDIDFIKDNLKLADKKLFESIELFDLARFYNLDSRTVKQGGLIECALENYNIDFIEDALFQDPLYRAEKIAQLLDVSTMKSYERIVDSKGYYSYETEDIFEKVIKPRKIKKGSIKK